MCGHTVFITFDIHHQNCQWQNGISFLIGREMIMTKGDKENKPSGKCNRKESNLIFLSVEVSQSAFIQTDNALNFFLLLQKNADTS